MGADRLATQSSNEHPTGGPGAPTWEHLEKAARVRRATGERLATKESQVERDVVTVRHILDYPDPEYGAEYISAPEALDRLARKAHEADRLIAQHELRGRR